ncbi:cyclin-I2-like [Canis lupus familiaris]|uniref:cyclin-I2-like n=1 Tax=Canis lupus familiaris TaxID=9615 RepID=UPI0018F60008|nr:cyclin-I2-like [Canis lupus familiaris]
MVAPSGARRRSPPWEWSNGAGFAGDVCQRSPKHRPGALETAAPRARAGSAQAHSALAPPRPRASRFLGLRSCACAEAFRVRLLGRPAEAAPAQCCRSAALLIWPAVGRGHLATYHRLTEGGAPGSHVPQRTQGCGPRPRRRPGAAVPAAALQARTPAAAVRPGRPPGRAPAGRPPAAGPGSRGAPVAGRPPPGSGPRGGGLPGARSPPSPRAHATRPGSTCVRAQVRRTPGAGTFPRCGLSTRPEAGIVGPSRRRGVEIRHTVRELVLWLLEVKNIFHFSQTTFNLALTTFSRLLVSLKMRERILQCVMITSLRLAAKVNEEEELIPRVKDFLKHYGSGYSPNELLRMELAILDKLHWDLYIGTPLDFLTIVSTRGWQSPL